MEGTGRACKGAPLGSGVGRVGRAELPAAAGSASASEQAPETNSSEDTSGFVDEFDFRTRGTKSVLLIGLSTFLGSGAPGQCGRFSKPGFLGFDRQEWSG